MVRRFLFIYFAAYLILLFYTSCKNDAEGASSGFVIGPSAENNLIWHAPDTSFIAQEPNAELIRYGQKLVANTSFYLGPKGTVSHLTNGLNCQNCHINAGTQPFGNNFGMVASTYPNFRPRSGRVENIFSRINECVKRSLNGKELDTTSREMLAISAYIYWISKDVQKGSKPTGAGGSEIAYLDRAADTLNGKNVYMQKCALCHGKNGEGIMSATGKGYQYPPLWGEHSYNKGASMYRLGKFAAYIKNNMPFGAAYNSPQLTDEEAWDIAAFVNSQNRPEIDLSKDWPTLSNKPVDYPFGPYTDNFTEAQHKYGPFKPIVEAKKQTRKKNS